MSAGATGALLLFFGGGVGAQYGFEVDDFFRPFMVANGRILITGQLSEDGVPQTALAWRVNGGHWHEVAPTLDPGDTFWFRVFGDSPPPWQPHEGRIHAWTQVGPDDISDDFSVDSETQYVADAGSLADWEVTTGALRPTANLTTRLRAVHAGATTNNYEDHTATIKVTPGTVFTDLEASVLLKRISANTYIQVVATDVGGTAWRLKTWFVIGGALTETTPNTVIPTFTAGVPFWLVGKVIGNDVIREYWTTDPALGGAPAYTNTVTMTGPQAAVFGTGITGRAGLSAIPRHVTMSLDDFQVEGNTYYTATLDTPETPKRLWDGATVVPKGTSLANAKITNSRWWWESGILYYRTANGPPGADTMVVWDPLFAPGEDYTLEIRTISTVDAIEGIITTEFTWPYDNVDGVGHMLDLVAPRFLAEGPRARGLFKSLGLLIGDFFVASEDMAAQTFPATATWGLAIWEEQLGFTTSSDLELSSRRALVVERVSRRGGTRTSFFDSLEAAVGPVTVVDDYANYKLTITLSDPSAATKERAEALVADLKPVGVEVVIQ